MKLLVVCSGNSGGISPIIREQYRQILKYYSDSLEIDYYEIVGRGFWGYSKNFFKIWQKIKSVKPQIIHAHYSFSGYLVGIVSLFFSFKVIVSLMGSDVKYKRSIRSLITRFFGYYIWDYVIFKSKDLFLSLNYKKNNFEIIPNGVDLDKFYPIDKQLCQLKLGLNNEKYIVLFPADPDRPEKNFRLAKFALENLSGYDFHILFLKNINHDDVVYYYNAADVVVLTSLWEGSPNVIKEAMACNKPIVATNVGDIRWLFDGLPGFFLSNFTVESLKSNIISAIQFSSNNYLTQGRDRIKELKIDDFSTATKIYEIYNSLHYQPTKV